MHLLDNSVGFMGSVPIVGSSLPIATGLALAEKLSDSKLIVVAYVGDAALETGAFYESLNLMALKKLPLLVILEDNEYSTYSNKSVRWAESKNVRKTIEGMGISYRRESGDDVEKVYTQVNNIISDVRNNNPSLLHLNTFRRYEHCGPNLDDNLGYRKADEINNYKSRDPIELLRCKILTTRVLSELQLDRLAKQVNVYVEDTFVRMLKLNEGLLAQFEMLD
jgi:pyruvate dehydrogenase E1 component alpha subunit